VATSRFKEVEDYNNKEERLGLKERVLKEKRKDVKIYLYQSCH